jgi:predicted RNA methylase
MIRSTLETLDDEITDEEFYQIENFYEIAFSKNVANANMIKPNDPNINKLAGELVNSFRQLTNAYIKNNNWTKFFELVDHAESGLLNKYSVQKATKLRLDEIYRILGDIFFKLDYNLNALEFYRRSLKLSGENNLLALESYENLLNLSIERWHYRMLNDKVRNSAYSRAIRKKLQIFQEKANGVKVFDVGTGTGLLSALCLDQKIDLGLENFKLFACEQSELFFKLSEKFLGSFNMNRHLKIFNKHSNDLKKNEDLPVVDMIVTEIFDDGLLGEGCLDTFYNLLFEKSILSVDRTLGVSRIVPQSAKIYIAAVECEFLRKSNYYHGKFRFNNQKIEVKATCLDNSEKFEKHPDSVLNYEPYTTDNLNQVDFQFLSEPLELKDLFIKFDDRFMLEKLCKRQEWISIRKKLQVDQDGVLDAYVLWFDLNLDSEITITNSPVNNGHNRAEISDCWQHAIYNLPGYKEVRSGDSLDVNIIMRNDCFLVQSSEIEEHKDNALSLDLNRFEIALLNNSTYQRFYVDWFESHVMKMAQAESKMPEDCATLKIGLMTSSFSLLLFKLLFEYPSILMQFNYHLIVELFINNELEHSNSSFYHYVQEKLKKCEHLRVNYLNNDLVLSARAQRGGMYDLDYLIYEPVDVRYGILRKNLMSDLAFVKNSAKNPSKNFFFK